MMKCPKCQPGKKLLLSITKKDFDIGYFSGKGAGGQHRNKHKNCVRLRHIDSGVTTTGQSHRNRVANLREAFRSLVKHPKFRVWHNIKLHEIISGERIEDKVKDMMRTENLKIEILENGEWHEQI